ncbi:MAG: PspC domain-containing protein, partial [Bacteroidota bacterium]|nr:PspC domain-containing protein [Bacteroidota bacterium]
MKKTFTINISGSVFHIDDDAFEKLQKYLQLLNRHFGTAIEGQEILQDIEARIAELFIEKTANKVEVVTNEMVDEVIARMGKPEVFMDSEEETSAKTQAEGAFQDGEQKKRRRLYRDGDNRVIGGVCSGLGAYFNIDPVILRVIFVVLFFLGVGASFLIYIILWIVVPKAK